MKAQAQPGMWMVKEPLGDSCRASGIAIGPPYVTGEPKLMVKARLKHNLSLSLSQLLELRADSLRLGGELKNAKDAKDVLLVNLPMSPIHKRQEPSSAAKHRIYQPR